MKTLHRAIISFQDDEDNLHNLATIPKVLAEIIHNCLIIDSDKRISPDKVYTLLNQQCLVAILYITVYYQR